MYILSDIICAWRAVVLWNRDKRVIVILLLFILGNINKPRGHALIMVGTTLGINLLCTGLIGWKAWCALRAYSSLLDN
ncbi:hypothetical protein BGW80DRAFT_1364365 [Lactifluus volemus]|nr:hypothetical protein BGW80DRAFT_1364365 [Lactifluus volemus]